MANGHGGYRRPEHPASVSGPGAHSRRTDGGPGSTHSYQSVSTAPDQPYGDAKQQAADQKLVPMAGQKPLPTPPSMTPPGQDAEFQMPAFQGVPLDAPTQRPNEHISTGANFGSTPGPEILTGNGGAQPGTGAMTALLSKYAATDASGVIGQLLQAAQTHNV